jgi:citrate synthase
MNCASCANNVERKLKKQPGITNASVNYTNGTAVVELATSSIDETELQTAVRSIGYDLIIDEEEVKKHLLKILNKKANDFSGKIYGIGHAVYTISDPRASILKTKARELAIEKGRLNEFELYSLVERLTPEVFRVFKGEKSTKIVCINVDFYSGFVYACLNISKELYTPLFAIARVSGWCTHRIEELTFSAKRIIRPAFKNVYGTHAYIPLNARE